MNERWLGSVAALLLGTSLVSAQATYLPEPDSQVLSSEQEQTSAPASQAAVPAQPVPATRVEAKVEAKVVSPPAPAPVAATQQPMPVVESKVPLRPVPAQAQVLTPHVVAASNAPCGCEHRTAWAQAEAHKERERVWASAEYLTWWLNDNRVPPLVGTLPAALAGQGAASLPPGAITTIFGDGNLNFHEFSGGRFTAGVWLDPEQYVGLEGSFFFLGRKNLSFGAASAGNPVVGPLFFDLSAGRESIITPVNPAQATETARVGSTERLWGSEVNIKSRLCYFADSPLDILAGFRYIDLRNDLFVNTAVDFTGAGVRAFTDTFAAKNQFYGGQIGAAFDMHDDGPWSFGITGKLGIGAVRETMTIGGFTTETPIGFPTRTFRGGILTAPSNIGQFSMTRFAVLPEMTFTLGYRVTSNFRLTFGYNFLWLSKAIYPGEAIDAVNPSNIRGLIVTNPISAVRPIPTVSQADLWAHGLNFGAELRF